MAPFVSNYSIKKTEWIQEHFLLSFSKEGYILLWPTIGPTCHPLRAFWSNMQKIYSKGGPELLLLKSFFWTIMGKRRRILTFSFKCREEMICHSLHTVFFLVYLSQYFFLNGLALWTRLLEITLWKSKTYI